MEATVNIQAFRAMRWLGLDGKRLVFWSLTLILGVFVLVPLSLLVLNSLGM